MKNNTFNVIPATSAYCARIVVCTDNQALKKRLDVLSMWGGSDKEMFNSPSWEMGNEELAVAVKWCRNANCQQVFLPY